MPGQADGDDARKSATNYIVSAQKPTVVNAAVVGHFRMPRTTDLIVARVNRIELLLFTAGGLRCYREIPIFGRIAVVKSFRPPGEVCRVLAGTPQSVLNQGKADFLANRQSAGSYRQIQPCHFELQRVG